MPARIQRPAVGRSLFERLDVLALQVLRDGSVLGLRVAQLADHDRNHLQPRALGSPVTALAVDDLELLVLRPHADGLKHADLRDAVRKLLQRIFVETLARVERTVDDFLHIEEQHRVRLQGSARCLLRTRSCRNSFGRLHDPVLRLRRMLLGLRQGCRDRLLRGDLARLLFLRPFRFHLCNLHNT